MNQTQHEHELISPQRARTQRFGRRKEVVRVSECGLVKIEREGEGKWWRARSAVISRRDPRTDATRFCMKENK